MIHNGKGFSFTATSESEEGSMLIRQAGSQDAEKIAQVRIDTWRTAYKGIVPQNHLDQLSLPAVTKQFQDLFKEEAPLVWVAEDEAEILGFVFGGSERNGHPEGGEVYAIYILDRYQGQGIGTQLMQAVSRELRRQGKTALTLWVLEQNPYRAFYERLGGKAEGKDTFNIDGVDLSLVSYRWADITQLFSEAD